MRELHGVKKGKHYCIWVDRVRIEKLSDTLYLARFDKWEKSGEVSKRQDRCNSWVFCIQQFIITITTLFIVFHQLLVLVLYQ